MAICINSSEYKTAACVDIQCEVQPVSRILKVDRTIACDGTKGRLFVEKASNEGAKIV